jgi:DmsE family decaheme c-type cytochrome
MKTTIRKALALFAFAAGLAVIGPAHAALPDMGSGGATRAAVAADKLKKDKVCTECHDETDNAPVLTMFQTKHGVTGDARTPTCQGCHGESQAHVKGNPSGVKADKRPAVEISFKKGGAYAQTHDKVRGETCQNCHQGGNRLHWDGGQHQMQGVSCNDCHTVHKPKDGVMAKATQGEVCYACHKKQRAESHRISTHPIEAGKVACSDCHNPHGSAGPKLVRKNTINETCFNCHAEKRGPFLWNHASANDDCMNCHTPHGSTVAPLLKARSPYLCQQCHGNTTPHPGNIYSGTALPGGTVANINNVASATNPINPLTGARLSQNNPPAQFPYRGCVNCHSAVHGSNHPGGIYLIR